MQLNITTDYAVRLCLYLASVGAPASGSDIAAGMHIPEGALPGISRPLRRAGILATQRGSGGGYCLARTAAEISLGEIVNAMEGTTRINRCLEDDHFCNRGAADSCPVRRFYQAQQEALDRDFYDKTIAILLSEG